MSTWCIYSYIHGRKQPILKHNRKSRFQINVYHTVYRHTPIWSIITGDGVPKQNGFLDNVSPEI